MISSDNFWQWFARWKRGIVVITMTFVLLLIFLQNAVLLIDVKVSGNPNKTANLTILNNNGVRNGVFHIGPVAFVPRDTGRIEAKYNNWQTTADITPLPLLGFKSVSLTVDPDKNATKVSGASLGCVSYDKQSEILASYSCGDPTGLFTYETSETNGVEWSNKAYLTFPRAYMVTDYRNGILGISNSKTPQLFYADMNSKAVILPQVPPEMDLSELRATSIVTDRTQDSTHFLLVSATKGDIYFATNINNSYEYRKFSIKKEWFDSKYINCALRGTKAYCYVGSPTFDIHSDDEEEANEETRVDGRIFTIDFTSDKVSYSTSLISKDNPIDTLYVDSNNQLYATSDINLYSLDTSGASVRRTITTTAFGNISSGATMYYVSDDKVYEFDSKTKQTKVRFYSDHLRLSSINQIDGKVYLNAYVNGDPGNLLHTYELNQEVNTTPGERLIDKLPIYQDKEQSTIVRMDVNGDKIHIVLPSYVVLSPSGTFVPDNKTYDISRQEAINYLSTKIDNLNLYKFTFSRADR